MIHIAKLIKRILTSSYFKAIVFILLAGLFIWSFSNKYNIVKVRPNPLINREELIYKEVKESTESLGELQGDWE